MTPTELSQAGFPVDADAHVRLSRFVDLLLEENKKLNLTGIRDPAQVWPLHICDSLAIAPLITAAGATRVIDLGSGGGVPGIPLACADPTLRVVLLDSTRKKTDALQRMIEALGLSNVSTVWGRAETLGHDRELRESFDGLTARAVAALPVLIDYAAGFLRVGGRCWFSKSCDIEAEIDRGTSAAKACGMRLLSVRSHRLPKSHGERSIVEYEKVSGSRHRSEPRP